jgi:hypothetical protein
MGAYRLVPEWILKAGDLVYRPTVPARALTAADGATTLLGPAMNAEAPTDLYALVAPSSAVSHLKVTRGIWTSWAR